MSPFSPTSLWFRCIALLTLCFFTTESVAAWNFFDPRPSRIPKAEPTSLWSQLPWRTAEESSSETLKERPQNTEQDARNNYRDVPPEDGQSPVASHESLAKALTDPTALSKRENDAPVSTSTRVSRSTPPSPDLILARLAPINEKQASALPEEPTKTPKEIVLAQALTMPTWDMRSQSAGQDADAETAAATALLENERYVDAAVAFVEVISKHPGTYQALVGDAALMGIVSSALSGALSSSVIDEIDAKLPSWESLSPEGKYAVMDIYNSVVEEASISGDTEAAARYLVRARNTALAFVQAHPNDPLVESVLDYYYDDSVLSGEKAQDEALALAESIVGTPLVPASSHGVFESIAALSALCKHYTKDSVNGIGLLGHYAGRLASQSSESSVGELFESSKVHAWVKGRYALQIGDAFATLRVI